MTTPIITIRQGKLRGVERITDYSKTKYYSFLGIPYAKPPIGNRRFQVPVPAGKWSGIFKADTYGSDCIQYSYFMGAVIGTEDCLYLNVHTPEIPSEDMKLKPVLFSIHCGGHNWGSGSENSLGSPDYLMQHDVVFVTINFRLHVFGFLNLGIRECPGNVGLKDIILALKWVKECIRSFGGDPDNVTAIGCSSGAFDIHLLMLSPLSKGLINKAIIQGGFGMDVQGAFHLDPMEVAVEYSKVLNYDGSNHPQKLLAFFKKKSTEELIEAVFRLRVQRIKSNVGGSCGLTFTTSVEQLQDGAFLPRSPFEMVDMVDKVPIIVGLCEDEGAYIFIANPIPVLKNDFKTAVKRTLWTIKMNEDLLTEVSERLRQFYFQDKPIDENIQQEIINFYTDAWKSMIYRLLIDIVSPEVPVYVYKFNYTGTLNILGKSLLKRIPKELTNATHADDYHYWNSICSSKYPTSSDKEMIDTMTSYFCNFAKTGNPNSDKTIEWIPTTVHKQCHIELNDVVKMADGRINDLRFKFWEDLYDYIESRNKIKN